MAILAATVVFSFARPSAVNSISVGVGGGLDTFEPSLVGLALVDQVTLEAVKQDRQLPECDARLHTDEHDRPLHQVGGVSHEGAVRHRMSAACADCLL